jgi:hypothetical protein
MTDKIKSTTTVETVEEIGNWVTTKRAAELMHCELPSIGAIIHAGRVKAIRISNIFLVDKHSAISFGKAREEIVNTKSAEKVLKERLSMLSELSNDQLEELLAKMNGK